ncbi:uncharacterized protein [Watersipora subatra]|uniref:uncharacterized protein n=1 Tax=Watersipora subatra TaxID=2589382 RepID=UPI00355AEFBD
MSTTKITKTSWNKYTCINAKPNYSGDDEDESYYYRPLLQEKTPKQKPASKKPWKLKKFLPFHKNKNKGKGEKLEKPNADSAQSRYTREEELKDGPEEKSPSQLSVQVSQPEQSTQTVPQLLPAGASISSCFDVQTESQDFGNLTTRTQSQQSIVVHYKQETTTISAASMLEEGTSKSLLPYTQEYKYQGITSRLMIEQVKESGGYWCAAVNNFLFKELQLPGSHIHPSATFHDPLMVIHVDDFIWRSADGRTFKLLPIPKEPEVNGAADCNPNNSHKQSLRSHSGLASASNQQPATALSSPAKPTHTQTSKPIAAEAHNHDEMNSRLTLSHTSLDSPHSMQPESTRDSADPHPCSHASDDIGPVTHVSPNRVMTEPNTIPPEPESTFGKDRHHSTNLYALQNHDVSKDDSIPVQSMGELKLSGYSKEIPSFMNKINPRPAFHLGLSSTTELGSAPEKTNTPSACGTFHWLERNASIQETKVLYAELLKAIAEILYKHEDIVAPLYFPSPSEKKLLIQGPAVGKAENEIKELEKKYAPCEIIVSEEQPVFFTQENDLPVYTEPLTATVPCSLHKNTPTPAGHCSVVGGYLKDNQHGSTNNLLAATAGHALLTEAEQRRLAESDAEDAVRIRTKEIGNDVAKRLQNYWIVPHNSRGVKVGSEVFVAYTHYIPDNAATVLKPEQMFCCDICLVQADATKLDPQSPTELAQISPLFTSLKDSGPFSSRHQLKRSVRIAGYIDIKNESDIDKLCEADVRLIVDEMKDGKLTDRPRTIDLNDESVLFTPTPQRRPTGSIAPHFAFTVGSGGLIPGKSGSAILVYNRRDDVCYILGLLMGTFKGARAVTNDVVYQAMPYGPAIKNLKLLYGDQLPNLMPMIGEESGIDLDQVLSNLADHHTDI